MRKNNPLLYSKDGEKAVLQKSKKIKKDSKKGLEAKKNLNQTKLQFSGGTMKEKHGKLNGNANESNLKIHKTLTTYKQEQNKAIKEIVTKISSDKALAKIGKEKGIARGEVSASDSAKDLAKIEKRKAKKLAQKLKKQKISESKNLENLNEAIQKEPIIRLPESEENLKIQTNNESMERDLIKSASTVFVGNLPVNTKRVQLIRLFNDYGPVMGIRFRTASGKHLFKHKQRKEAGSLSAWVILKDAETATRALELNGTVFKNNHLRITSSDLNSGSIDAKRTIFVGNLKYSANEEKLREIFSNCGDIDYVRCLNEDKGCKGVAYVCFKAPEAIGLALELNETILDERPIHVERYAVRKLGAKKAREAKGGGTKKSPLDGKKVKGKERGDAKGDNLNTKNTDSEKKNKFRGVKVDGIKKKQKKVTSQMQKLANKIAPK